MRKSRKQFWKSKRDLNKNRKMFSRATEYAIKAMLFINLQKEEGVVSLGDIIEAIGSPTAFTAKILQQLRKKSLLVSNVGVKGGFSIPLGKEISIKEIVVAIEGNGFFESCVLGLKECSASKPCPMHHVFFSIRKQLEVVLQTTSLDDFSENLLQNKISLK
ncbi:MAG: RrF2 family transcriptional regulator [Bacteroidia bacterium]